MAYRVRPIAIAVMALRPKDRTETHTDIAPSWMRAAAMAPMVIEARKGIKMVSFLMVVEVPEMKRCHALNWERLGSARKVIRKNQNFIVHR